MRSSKLITALATIALALGLTCTAAIARPLGHGHRRPRSGVCRINIQAPRAPLTAGEPATLFGHLLCAMPAADAGQTVTVFEHKVGTPGVLAVGSAVTEAGGAYQLTVPAISANSAFYARVGRIQSVRRSVRVAPQVSLTSPGEGAQLLAAALHHASNVAYNGARDRVVFAGHVSPVQPGSIAVLQRESEGSVEEWHRIGSAPVNTTTGTYAIAHNFRVPGDANIRVVVRPPLHGPDLYGPGASTPVSYEISQAQIPGLSINTSADPTSVAAPVTISGVLTTGAGVPVTLLSHSKGGHFEPSAKTLTDSGGHYSFTESPQQDAFYWVRGGGKASSVLFEGVKYALTAMPSASALLTGQALTVTGTLAPVRAGHAVYLERQNRSGIGFHVIDVAPLSAAGTYTITHAFYGVGTARLRIKAPGDSSDQGAEGPPFEVNVMPAPASQIAPEAAGNSTLPSTGEL